ncbi:TPA: FtsX-like permease family protein [Bacillus cereus]|uniref:ABC transporter permease n=3 Tax=Bacillus TaxID=1386 RepID=A0A2A9A3B1_BACCE|nr:MULTISPECIES: FtsX-like permease family protein [Bacillus]MCP1180698.1 FtsX-like permease family protein [Bacillus sp. 1663tsa1]MCP1284313.1 FtsX-like permease family protein [Bacillus sp. S0635]MCU5750734.1 FtsX-like permease family protein [Bacillus cereus]MDA1635961.1 ABC transporter permease [Bacillus cereus]PFE15701.1 ABC transporter permease [Bacillus cereus]
MIRRMLKRDFSQNKMIITILFMFIMLSSLLMASASSNVINLLNSMDRLFKVSNAPHFVQMHAGEINQQSIDLFVAKTPFVKKQQTAEMIQIGGSNIFIKKKSEAEHNSVMDISFVKQNSKFDLLLNLNNEVVDVRKGEIGVPIYYMQKYNLRIGDKIWVVKNNNELELTISSFVRDVQMNPSIVSSKRFVISDEDFERIKGNFGESEYLIEFQLTDVNKINEFEHLYESSNLPQKGPSITYSLFKTLNSLTDGIIAAVLIIISALLMLIAILCIRFTIMTSMEEDYREIGVMKAIGITSKEIQKLYVTKYVVIAASGCICGYILSLFVTKIFTSNISLYMGIAETSILHFSVPLIVTTLLFLAVILFCRIILRNFRRITAIDALRSRDNLGKRKVKSSFSLSQTKITNVNIFIGIQDVVKRFKLYRVLSIVLIIAVFMIVVPVNFLYTIQSPKFVNYMGTGKSDIRIDLQQTENIEKRFKDVISYLRNDDEVEKYAAFVTSTFKMVNADGTHENLNVEVGDFTQFPVDYMQGMAPKNENEIAFSYMNANELKKNVGDEIVLFVEGKERVLTISGIYQDVTNGGKTAKASFPYNSENILWYVVNVDIKPTVNLQEKVKEYKHNFSSAKITDTDDYLTQTLGETIKQLRFVTQVAILIAILISVLITAMFFKMLLAKDSSQILIMKSIGFSYKDIRIQYITRSIVIVLIGIVTGTLLAATFGEMLVSRLGSFMGAAHIKFVVNPIISYIICPAILFISVTATTLFSSFTMKQTNELKRNGE